MIYIYHNRNFHDPNITMVVVMSATVQTDLSPVIF